MSGKEAHDLAQAGEAPTGVAFERFTDNARERLVRHEHLAVARNPWTGAQRSEGQITFNMALLPADRSVMIYHVAGTSVIKAGRHTLTVDTDGSLSTSWEWTDTNNRSQTVSLTVSRSGEFSGSWRSSSPLDQTPFGALIPVSIAGSFSGVCL